MSADTARPDANHPGKPDSPTDLRKPTWTYTLRRAATEFIKDQSPDQAAALTYYAVLSIFPGLIALVSILGLIGRAESTTQELIDIMGSFVPADSMDQLEPIVQNLMDQQGAGIGLVIGLLTAMWTASNYVNAFSRAMNRVYEVDEGRPAWKLRPLMYGMTAVVLVLIAIAALLLVISGPVAEAIGEAIGLGSVALTVWNIAKWPALLLVVIIIIALLYYATPNVRQPKFRWISMGAVIAIVVAALASAAFGFYVSRFSNYEASYGALAGVIIFLLWLWIMNLALLFGAEFDAETERGRQLQAGIPAEIAIQLPLRDDAAIQKREAKEQKAIEEGRALRLSAGRRKDPDAVSGA